MNIRRETRVAFSLFALTLGVAALVVPGSAGAARAEVEHWRHGDIARFHHEDLGRWRGGRWFHGEHFGRLGWWWIVDSSWFLYPAPVYPYPDPYIRRRSSRRRRPRSPLRSTGTTVRVPTGTIRTS